MPNLTATPAATEYVECDAEIDGENIECDFAGDVEVEITAECGFIRTVRWTCPDCDTVHTDDRDIRDQD